LTTATCGYHQAMLYTILIILAIVALLLFIFGRRRA
jgi:LPXTG-motif cell wall-anchored protein